MAIDTIKRNKIVKGLFFPILSLVAMFCFSSAQERVQNSSTEDKCRLFRKEFSVDISSYKEFSKPLSEFFESRNPFDLVFIKMKGGNHSASEMKRWYISSDSVQMISWNNEGKQTFLLHTSVERVLELATLIESGEFLQICPYSSSNDSFLLLIKVNSVVKFKYSSTDMYYQALSVSERNQISNVINLFSYLSNQK